MLFISVSGNFRQNFYRILMVFLLQRIMFTRDIQKCMIALSAAYKNFWWRVRLHFF